MRWIRIWSQKFNCSNIFILPEVLSLAKAAIFGLEGQNTFLISDSNFSSANYYKEFVCQKNITKNVIYYGDEDYSVKRDSRVCVKA